MAIGARLPCQQLPVVLIQVRPSLITHPFACGSEQRRFYRRLEPRVEFAQLIAQGLNVADLGLKLCDPDMLVELLPGETIGLILKPRELFAKDLDSLLRQSHFAIELLADPPTPARAGA
mgnify:CR=1 FL=1